MKKIVWLFFLFILGITAHRYAAAEVIITEKEAALPAAAGAFASRGISRGPAIKLESPAADILVSAPFAFKVKFEPRGGAKIDPSSIKVVYLKSPLVDLTQRLKSSTSSTGIELTNAKAPSGTHPIRVMIKDSEGRESNLIFNLVIGP